MGISVEWMPYFHDSWRRAFFRRFGVPRELKPVPFMGREGPFAVLRLIGRRSCGRNFGRRW